MASCRGRPVENLVGAQGDHWEDGTSFSRKSFWRDGKLKRGKKKEKRKEVKRVITARTNPSRRTPDYAHHGTPHYTEELLHNLSRQTDPATLIPIPFPFFQTMLFLSSRPSLPLLALDPLPLSLSRSPSLFLSH